MSDEAAIKRLAAEKREQVTEKQSTQESSRGGYGWFKGEVDSNLVKEFVRLSRDKDTAR